MSHLFRLVASATAAFALAAGTLAGPAHAGDSPPQQVSGDWLVTQLTGGLVHNDQYAFDDYGLSIDVALSLRALGGYDATVQEIGTAIADHVNSYTTGVDWGSSDIYAGATAKALVLAQVARADATSYGGVNLVTRLNRRIATTTPLTGRLQDKTSGTDYANVIGQAFAVRALAKAGSPKASSALGFLLKQQCQKGFFRLNFTPSKTRANQTCDGGSATASAPDTDATAIAVISLSALHSRKPVVKSAIADAVSWLKKRQKADGSFGGGTSTEGSNANSTGLAGWALGVRGACAGAQEAADWLAALQVQTATGGTPLVNDIGAIGYDKATYDAVVAAQEITVAQRDQWRRATAQAAPALVSADLAACQAR